MRLIAGVLFVFGVIWLVGLPFLGLMLFLWVLLALGKFALGVEDR